jgi:hypothetical protein
MSKTSEFRKTPQDLRKLAELLDSKYALPFGWRIGWDGILGFIPGIGDMLTNGLSFYIIYRAAMLGCSPSVILRMGLNLVIDNFVSIFPLIGHIFDFMWKANNKNIQLIENYLQNPTGTRASARFVITMTLILVAASMVGAILCAFWLLHWLWAIFQSPSATW